MDIYVSFTTQRTISPTGLPILCSLNVRYPSQLIFSPLPQPPHPQGDNSGPPPVGANMAFRSGLGIVVQQFDSEKEAKLLQVISRREGLLENLVLEVRGLCLKVMN